MPVIGQDIGGTNGRSVQVYVGDGRVLTKSGLEEPFEVGGPQVKAHGRKRSAPKPPPAAAVSREHLVRLVRGQADRLTSGGGKLRPASQ